MYVLCMYVFACTHPFTVIEYVLRINMQGIQFHVQI